MFKIESYVTPILLSYVDKYVRDFKPADAQVSLWGGGVVLHNLVLKADVLQQEVALPFTLVSGRIHELLIQVPWTKIMSEPIVVTIDTIECVLSLTQPTTTGDECPPPETSRTPVVEAPPGYMQALVRRIVSNIALRVHHLIVKYVQDDIVMSLNVKHLAVDSAGPNWEAAFADIDQTQPVIRRLMRLDDLTLCLDRTDADGKIRFYQEPLLYRCQLNFRILTRLVSANIRRASSLSIQLRSTKLVWGVTGDQLTLLFRLLTERSVLVKQPNQPTPVRKSSIIPAPNIHPSSSNSAEVAREPSWSEWAWSWMPALSDNKDLGPKEVSAPPTPLPVHFAAYFDDIDFVFKVMETEGSNRKRVRSLLELNASWTTFKSSIFNPTTIRMQLGIRHLLLLSRGKCVCGYTDYNALHAEPTIYLRKEQTEGTKEWSWPDDEFNRVEYACLDYEHIQPPPVEADHLQTPETTQNQPKPEDKDRELWRKMEPQCLVEYIHERSPPSNDTNPYENPPNDFQYSDWVEVCHMKIKIQPTEVKVCMGLLHRLATVEAIINDFPPTHGTEMLLRTLTVEECEALSENLPQRQISVEASQLHIQVYPWDHSLSERASLAPLVLDLDVPKISIDINGPLYPHRVCAAACQMPGDNDILWQGARLHVTLNIEVIQANICSLSDGQTRPCARADLKAVMHILLHKRYFTRHETVVMGYSIKIREINLCGSAPRLQAAYQVLSSLQKKCSSITLKLTTLASDALSDEESVAVDVTFEDITARGYITENVNTHIITLHSVKATALHEIKGSEPKQAWLFSAPDALSTTPYLRMAVQWCNDVTPEALDYLGIWTEPIEIAFDPLFIAWLAYKPILRPLVAISPNLASFKNISSQYLRRKTSSSSRHYKLSIDVHGCSRSLGSSDKTESREAKRKSQEKAPSEDLLDSSKLIPLHERLKRMLLNLELGMSMLYVTMTTASALDCATVRDAMERHAGLSHPVVAFSLGRTTMSSSALTRQFWQDIRHDGPTFLTSIIDDGTDPLKDSFPWKLRLADMSCYTLEIFTAPSAEGKDINSKLRSRLKVPCIATPRAVISSVTTTVTLSVVTKSVQIRQIQHRDIKKGKTPTLEEIRVKYFKSGVDFKPTTLKEFVRGPARRKKEKTPEPVTKIEEEDVIKEGPLVSIGVHLHADTPPLTITLEHDQVHVIGATVHCFMHIVTMLKRPPLLIPKSALNSTCTFGGSQRSFKQSKSELDEGTSEDTLSDTKSELIPIFDAETRDMPNFKTRTFFWFQWVVSRVTLLFATNEVKLAFETDDIISTMDLQAHYNQFKIKVASASVRHYSKNDNDEWKLSKLGGRVLVAKEPQNSKEENHFLSVTITQAQISNLPTSWREELHPKILEQNTSLDSMWEIYATLAPLEVIISPVVMRHTTSLIAELAPRALCPLKKEKSGTHASSDWVWPFCYITAGGLRLMLTTEVATKNTDDSFMIVIGKVSVNPHPENPICRQLVSPGTESWTAAGATIEGRQYEVFVKNVGVRCAHLNQFINNTGSESELLQGTASENPALKWSQKTEQPNITPVLHAVDIGFLIAPALYIRSVLTCGPAIELNLVSDCVIEVSLDQIILAQKMARNFIDAVRESDDDSISFDDEAYGICPYAALFDRHSDEFLTSFSNCSLLEDNIKALFDPRRSATDSGFDTVTTSTSKMHESQTLGQKRSVTVAFVEQNIDASEFLEVFVTMGTIELSLYCNDDDDMPEILALRPPKKWVAPTTNRAPDKKYMAAETRDSDDSVSSDSPEKGSTKSLTNLIRDVDVGHTMLDPSNFFPNARKALGALPLVNVTLNQPNFYYSRKKAQKSLQVSLFNMWVGFGAGLVSELWHEAILSTAKGVEDPATDIPPALATMKMVVPNTASSMSNTATTGTIRVDIERPVMLEVTTSRLARLKNILSLIKKRHVFATWEDPIPNNKTSNSPLALYSLRKLLVHQGIESITIATTQMCLSGGSGVASWDSLSLQFACGARPERIVARALITAAAINAGLAWARHGVLQPVMIGLELEGSWEAWRRAEGGPCARDPTLYVCCCLDTVTLDLRPSDLAALVDINTTVQDLLDTEDDHIPDNDETIKSQTLLRFNRRLSIVSTQSTDDEHFYKDDLRSGAFKIVEGVQLPMAYQVTLNNNAVSWRYPHPRTITRLTMYPLPGEDEETECVLEFYCSNLSRWEPHTYFSIPVGEPRELQLYVPSPDAVYAVMWRFRVFEGQSQPPPFKFDIKRFMPRNDPLKSESKSDPSLRRGSCGVTSEQLAGAVRVDSCFSPRMSPRTRFVMRFALLNVHVHNDLPHIPRSSTTLEGYYVSKPLHRAHRVISLCARDATLLVHHGSPAGSLALIDACFSSDIIDCETGTMEQFIEEFHMQAGLSLPSFALSRTRVALSRVLFALNVPRLRTLQSLELDWRRAVEEHLLKIPKDPPVNPKLADAEVVEEALGGRVSLWIVNGCNTAVRVGQEGTEEVVPLGVGTRLAYRWQSPTAPKKLRFALAGSSADCRWSSSITFSVEHNRVRLYNAENLGSSKMKGAGVYLHTKVDDQGSHRTLTLTGRLSLANMLRFNIIYKVRARSPDTNQWLSVSSDQISTECIGRSIVCGADCDMVLKIKLANSEIGWSGDIPLKECPKENVPWLVKVPSEGETPYISIWCRVIRARSDGRIFATLWPLFVLYSHLPLDIDVLIVTEQSPSSSDENAKATRVQAALGRGSCTHLLAPGTTAARHLLSFQYSKIDCPVTKEAIPLHYGVTNTSVFEKRGPVKVLEDIISDTKLWLEKTRRDAVSSWPYSIVSKHWPSEWLPSMLQPRCDVTVQYKAVRVGGGCSLEVTLFPVVLLCNAAPIALTLRAHDAAPLCKLEPGTAISPPSNVLKKPFFISVEMGRETFVSGELSVYGAELGRYEAPPSGRVALDHATEFAVQCNHKVALLSMYYEIKEDMNILGLTTTYILVNRLDSDIHVSAMAVPKEMDEESFLRPSAFKVISPTPDGSVYGTPLCKFWVVGHVWRGSSPTDLRLYLCLTLQSGQSPTHVAPVRLGKAPLRRGIALLDSTDTSVSVVVTQIKHEGRWVVTVARDPCPQLLVYNRTGTMLAIAEADRSTDTNSSAFKVLSNCTGTRWLCTMPPGALIHYSTPSHCHRYPPPANASTSPLPVTFLTFAKAVGAEQLDLLWCSPVACADGEQLLQLANNVTLKMRVRTHPHSTLVEIRNVDENDISASDIRKRLYGAFESVLSQDVDICDDKTSVLRLERINADEKLLDKIKLDAVEDRGKEAEEALNEVPRQIYVEPPTELRLDTLQAKESKIIKVDPTESTLLNEEPSEPKLLDKEPAAFNLIDKKPSGLNLERSESTLIEEKPTCSTAAVNFLLDDNINQSTLEIFASSDERIRSRTVLQKSITSLYPDTTNVLQEIPENEWEETSSWTACDRVRLVAAAVGVEISAAPDTRPLLALHLDRAALLVRSDARRTKTTISIADVQIDNLQYASGQFDFAVVASTRAESLPETQTPPLWSWFAEKKAFSTRDKHARALLRLTHDQWAIANYAYRELAEVEIRLGPLALYIEDAYVKALAELCRSAGGNRSQSAGLTIIAEERAMRAPLRFRSLTIHPLDLMLNLHTAIRMYIALDQSPLRLSAFKLTDAMTSTENLTHALTLHYLSAAILGAGWVVGGLELLGAPGALAARVGGATGGVRGVASATAAALLRSLSAAAGSLARNLDLLAGDEEHARRAAAARRQAPASFVAGVVTGLANFAINILGAVGGLAHHPLVGVAVGDIGGATALRRGIVGALTKPLSATADLVAYAGHGLLSQTGWDPVPQPRLEWRSEKNFGDGWRRDCVRWTFRLAELPALAGFHVLIDGIALHLLITHKFLVLADLETERIVEMIDFKFCSIGPYLGQIIELVVTQRQSTKPFEVSRATNEDDEVQISAAAMARVARYTGTEGGAAAGAARILSILPAPGQSLALHASLAAAAHCNSDSHFPLL